MMKLLVEGSKRVKLHSRTESDLRYVADKVFNAWKNKETEENLEKGRIMMVDPTGNYAYIPVYYLDTLKSNAGVYNRGDVKNRVLQNIFMVVNPNRLSNPTRKTIYHTMYHELQHLMDLNNTEFISDKRIGNYNPESSSDYWGHDFEFRAHVNEILNAMVNEFQEKLGTTPKEELKEILTSIINGFAKNRPISDQASEFLFDMYDETWENEYPTPIYVLHLLRVYNPTKWNKFLKMLYSTGNEIIDMIDKYDDH